MSTKKQTRKEKEFEDNQLNEIKSNLELINQNLLRLFNNDEILNQKLLQMQQGHHPFKEIEVSNDGIKITSRQPLRDIIKLVNNPQVKTFYDECRKNSIMRQISYID